MREYKGNTIAQLIIDTLVKSGLNKLMGHSQTYDGARNMACKQKCASNQFKELRTNQTAITKHHTN